MDEPLLSALVSTYASERYLRGCLDSLLAQTLGARLDILVVDADSPEREGEIVRSYMQRHGNIRYVRSPAREGTSQAFDRATALARGRYLTTANTDDRHHPEFAARLTAALDRHPEFGIAYADSAITHVDNETWQRNTATLRYAWPDYTPATALSCCLFGAQPVWRRAAHDVVGGWNAQRARANDQDMFLRIALRFGAVHLREELGLFLMRPDSVSGASNRDDTLAEVLQVMRHYRTVTPLEVVFPALAEHPGDAVARAAALFELGNLCALGPYTDAGLALDCYRQAACLELPAGSVGPLRAAFANNSACVLHCAGLAAESERALRAAGVSPAASTNAARIAEAARRGAVLRLRDLAFVELDHPVIRSSRTSSGLEPDPVAGGLRWGAPALRRPWDVFDGPSGAPRSGVAQAPAPSGR
ncbi:MAG: glycosyltransferase [Planctomycetes bacterium]|nr:glycosyltransferase [Planctomycetota bacterium]